MGSELPPVSWVRRSHFARLTGDRHARQSGFSPIACRVDLARPLAGPNGLGASVADLGARRAPCPARLVAPGNDHSGISRSGAGGVDDVSSRTGATG
jgi:hypothetical protein